MSRTGPVNRATMSDHYRTAYFTGSKPDQTLNFENLSVRPLPPDHAVMIGRYVLTGGSKPDQSGWFTLIWVRTASGWKIIHDHSG
jgi:ketosteroid isomerase-like protein